MEIDDAIDVLLSGPQKKQVKELMRCGYGKREAVRYLINLGIRVKKIDSLEIDLCHGTRYALREDVQLTPN